MECTRLVVAAGGVAAAVVTALGTTDAGPVGPPGAVPAATTLLRPTGPTVLASAPPPRDTLRAANRAW